MQVLTGRYRLGVKLGFVLGAAAIAPFACYAGLAAANYFGGLAAGAGNVARVIVWVLAFNIVAATIMAVDGLVGAAVGGVIHAVVLRLRPGSSTGAS